MLLPARSRPSRGIRANIRRRKTVRRLETIVLPALGDPGVDAPRHAIHLQIGHRALAERAGKLHSSVTQADQAADDLDAFGPQEFEIDRAPFRRADQLQRRQVARD